MIPIIIFLLFIGSASCGHPYDPHETPNFEGWYSRITSSTRDIGVIFGSFPSQSSSNRNLVSLIIKDGNASLLSTIDWHPPTVEIKKCAGDPCFTVSSTAGIVSLDSRFLLKTAEMSVTPQSVSYNIEYLSLKSNESTSLQISISNHMAYSPLGPEGLLSNLGPLLPLHWFVYSINSLATIRLNTSTLLDIEQGHAHLEKNWGNAFPNYWIWAQVNHNDIQLALAGGDLGFSMPIINRFRPFLFQYRSPRVQLIFYPEDYLFNPLKVKVEETPSIRSLRLKGSKSGVTIDLTITAARSSFAKVQCPTRQGFTDYSIESYSAKTHIRLFNQKSGVLIEEYVIDGAALEFGGKHFMKDPANFQIQMN